MRRVRVRAIGRVQGVFFRETIRRRAHDLELAGWVRNVGPDMIEAIFEGEADSVERALEFMRVGPVLAAVRSFEAEDEPPQGESGPFRVLS